MFRRRGICFWIGIACVVAGVFIILALVLPAGFWWFALGGALIAAGGADGGITAVCPA